MKLQINCELQLLYKCSRLKGTLFAFQMQHKMEILKAAIKWKYSSKVKYLKTVPE